MGQGSVILIFKLDYDILLGFLTLGNTNVENNILTTAGLRDGGGRAVPIMSSTLRTTLEFSREDSEEGGSDDGELTPVLTGCNSKFKLEPGTPRVELGWDSIE